MNDKVRNAIKNKFNETLDNVRLSEKNIPLSTTIIIDYPDARVNVSVSLKELLEEYD